MYSIGSLYTSLMPCLALRGVGECIAKSTNLKSKILLLNNVPDRETPGYTATDFVTAIHQAALVAMNEDGRQSELKPSDLM